MLERILLLLAWAVGIYIVWIAFKKIPVQFFNYLLYVLMGFTMFFLPIVAIINWIVAGNLDFTFSYPMLIVALDVIVLFMTFISLCVRGDKDKDVNLNLL